MHSVQALQRVEIAHKGTTVPHAPSAEGVGSGPKGGGEKKNQQLESWRQASGINRVPSDNGAPGERPSTSKKQTRNLLETITKITKFPGIIGGEPRDTERMCAIAHKESKQNSQTDASAQRRKQSVEIIHRPAKPKTATTTHVSVRDEGAQVRRLSSVDAAHEDQACQERGA